MVLDLVTKVSDDGYSAEVTSVEGCETWAHTEEEAIQNAIELLSFYIGLEDSKKIKIDKARKERNKSVYKLIFNK